jgi:hypothetical protein
MNRRIVAAEGPKLLAKQKLIPSRSDTHRYAARDLIVISTLFRGVPVIANMILNLIILSSKFFEFA